MQAHDANEISFLRHFRLRDTSFYGFEQVFDTFAAVMCKNRHFAKHAASFDTFGYQVVNECLQVLPLKTLEQSLQFTELGDQLADIRYFQGAVFEGCHGCPR